MEFHSLFKDLPEELSAYTPGFTIKLFNLSGPMADAIAGSAVVRMMAEILAALGKPDFLERIAKTFAILNELAEAPGFARYFEILFRYILDVYDVPREDLMDMAIEKIKKDVREAAMTTYEQIKQEGRIEGKAEAAAAILARQLAKRFHTDPESFLPLLKRLDFVQYEELSEKILEAENIQEIRQWLEAAGNN